MPRSPLRFIGADPFLKLLTEARKLYYSTQADHNERNPEIEPLDNAFYNQSKSPFVLIGEYVLSHLTEYCVD